MGTMGYERAGDNFGAIAIVGMSGRFPDARDVEELWQKLRAGVECIATFTEAELLAAGVSPEMIANPNHVRAGAPLEDVELFDASFFGFSPREAESMDPQQRIFLETVWEALERAGYDPETYAGSIGVFAGSSPSGYHFLAQSDPEIIDALGHYHVMLSNDKDYLTTRASYKLNLRGPSVCVQTSCSTSLVAVVMAYQSLLNHECDMALAGGVGISAHQRMGYLYQEGGISSPDGHCRAFDAAAKGTVGGNGIGIVVMKRLADALADGDHVHAVIRGAAINNDGSSKIGFTAPSVQGQAEVIAMAQALAGVEPEEISYIEAHGTGTPLGDPIEIAALTRVFRAKTARRQFCAIGSIKTNLGHLDAAAGVASLIKTVMALEHRELPPSLHFERPNPKLDLESSPFYVNTRLTPWQSADGPRRAGVSSFGIGGTNAHVILEEAPPRPPSGPSRRAQVLTLSARSEAALARVAAEMADYLERHPEVPLADIAYTTHVGRKAFAFRRVVVGESAEELRAALLNASPPQSFTSGQPATQRPIVFVFPGQGAKLLFMARELYESEPVFRQSLDHCAELLYGSLGLDLRQILYPAEGQREAAEHELGKTVIAQSALFAIELSLAKLWMAWGIVPHVMVGHGVGEFVAACMAGVFRLGDALHLIVRRGQSMQQTAGPMDEDFARLVAGVERRPPSIPLLSTLTGNRITAEALADPVYWARQGEWPDRFASCIKQLLSEAQWIWVEMGAGQTLRALVGPHAGRGPGQVLIPSLPHANDAGAHQRPLLEALGRVWVAGGKVEWRAFHEDEARRRVPLPTYPFERQRFWASPRWWSNQLEAPRATSQMKVPNVADWFYVPSWKRTEPPVLLSAETAPTQRSVWLMFVGNELLGSTLEEGLVRRGQEVVTVVVGERFEQAGARRYRINPGERGDYAALIARLEIEGRSPDRIVHAFCTLPADTTRAEHETALAMERRLGFDSLLFLTQALCMQRPWRPALLSVVTTQMHTVTGAEAIEPLRAMLIGPCRVIPQEIPHISCRNIDVELPADESSAAQLASWLIADLERDSFNTMVAYRGGHRWVEGMEPTGLGWRTACAPPRLLRQRGTYLITGGLGGIGLVAAELLAREARARLILVGRTGLPERERWDEWIATHDALDCTSRKLRKIRAIEATGAEVMVAVADVSDFEGMRRGVEEGRARFGRIDGIVHAAGISGGGTILTRTPKAAWLTMASKVGGTLVLDALFREEPPDFVVLCSSLSSLVGGASEVDYCAANAFLDAYAQSRMGPRGCHVIAVNWDTWSEVGMVVDLELAAERERTRLESLRRGMSSSEGADALRRILSGNLRQVAVCTSNLPGWMETQKCQRAEIPPTRPCRACGQGLVAPETATERHIATIWQEVLGVDGIGVHDNFFEIGGEWPMVTRVLSRILQSLQVEIPLRAFFEAPTVAGISFMVETMKDRGRV